MRTPKRAVAKRPPAAKYRPMASRSNAPLVPNGVYIGSEITEGYELLLLPEMDTLYRRKESYKKAEATAINLAIDRAFALSAGKCPDCDDRYVPAISIILSAPKEEIGYDETVAHTGLPPIAAALVARYPNAQHKYKIVTVSVEWTARWVILPVNGIDFPDNDGIIPSGIITYIGNKAFDFGCPQPIKNNIIIRDMIYDMAEPNPHPHMRHHAWTPETFKAGLDANIEKIRKETEEAVFKELKEAIVYLPKCPLDQVAGGLSISIGYPKNYAVIFKELHYEIDTPGVVQNEAGQNVMGTIKKEMLKYEITGNWSWSVQRTCGAPKAKPGRKRK